MARIETEHEGFKLWLNEDPVKVSRAPSPEQWCCSELGLKAKSLKALRAKINKHLAEERKVSHPCGLLPSNNHSDPKIRRATISMVAKRSDWVRNYSWDRRKDPVEDREVPTVWVTVMDGNKARREKVKLAQCVDVSDPATADLVRDAQRLYKEAQEAKARAEAAFDAIPYMSLDDITKAGVTEREDEE